MPARLASSSTASGKVTFSISMTKLKTLPPLPLEKHLKICLSGETMNEGVFSWVKGESAL